MTDVVPKVTRASKLGGVRGSPATKIITQVLSNSSTCQSSCISITTVQSCILARFSFL